MKFVEIAEENLMVSIKRSYTPLTKENLDNFKIAKGFRSNPLFRT